MSAYDFSRISILIVEDNVYIRNTFENLLRSFQFGKSKKPTMVKKPLNI